MAPVDANDNGMSLIEKKHEVSPFLIQDMFSLMRPTWAESHLNHDKNFVKAVEIAKEILLRSIVHARDAILAEEKILQAHKDAKDKRIIVLDNYYPFKETFDTLPEPFFAIYPRDSSGVWCVKAIRKDDEDFKNRKDLPEAWAGLENEELQKISGVKDAIFCHRGLFIAVAGSREGAVKLAQIALDS